MTRRVVQWLIPAVLRAHPVPAPGRDKEDRGRVSVVGGSRQVPGAALLASEAALRAGAGKLQIGTAGSLVAALALAVPEAMFPAMHETAGEELAASMAAPFHGSRAKSKARNACPISASSSARLAPSLAWNEIICVTLCRNTAHGRVSSPAGNSPAVRARSRRA
ncbi:NAD(P)H-hydrate dehydratase [Stenotrophomonas sp. RS-48]|uniref:NAD(P)H-hydrate dehydratase n=1 Tax=Stenotrophomonas sp. RS-48 TaxID=3043300 RepID=UPI0024B567A1|nr:NAD(P)H-hydrate dehydratase [Stenotrophomonas sp. RS-48]MDI9248303.1 NAD(P)H-hydrate dehydratase [Stenotrophomonas sp. RS-48]